MRPLAGTLLAIGTAWMCRAVWADPTDADIVALDAIALRTELAAGRLSAERVTNVFLHRIATLDDAGPTLNAVIEINGEALAIARALDARHRTGVIGPLHGVPVLIKANIDTADAMATSAGSLALAGHRARADALVVTRLREAGAVVLGKTNLSEWANFRSTASTSGWSSLGGQTRHPYVLDRNPCGSSSGSAVAVAARLAPLAVGTETDGSIACPAGANGIVGIKPALGAVSQHGIVPLAASQDSAGPMARTVADAALLLAVLSGQAPNSAARPGRRADLSGMRVGVVRNYHGAGADSEVETLFAATLRSLERAGATLIDASNAGLPAEVEQAEFEILLAEFRDQAGAYLATVTNGPRTLDDLIRYNERNASQVLPHFGQELFVAAQQSAGTATAGYRANQALIAEARTALAGLFAAANLDALVAPANARAWRTVYAAGDTVGVSSSSIAAVSGYPSVVVPAGLVRELPLGVAFIGRPGHEAALLDIAAALERVRGPFPEPQFLPSVAE